VKYEVPLDCDRSGDMYVTVRFGQWSNDILYIILHSECTLILLGIPIGSLNTIDALHHLPNIV
jgi:hypothetical protein